MQAWIRVIALTNEDTQSAGASIPLTNSPLHGEDEVTPQRGMISAFSKGRHKIFLLMIFDFILDFKFIIRFRGKIWLLIDLFIIYPFDSIIISIA